MRIGALRMPAAGAAGGSIVGGELEVVARPADVQVQEGHQWCAAVPESQQVDVDQIQGVLGGEGA
jgi:hypothetical protein